jgi:hypothetical protein
MRGRAPAQGSACAHRPWCARGVCCRRALHAEGERESGKGQESSKSSGSSSSSSTDHVSQMKGLNAISLGAGGATSAGACACSSGEA